MHYCPCHPGLRTTDRLCLLSIIALRGAASRISAKYSNRHIKVCTYVYQWERFLSPAKPVELFLHWSSRALPPTNSGTMSALQQPTCYHKTVCVVNHGCVLAMSLWLYLLLLWVKSVLMQIETIESSQMAKSSISIIATNGLRPSL